MALNYETRTAKAREDNPFTGPLVKRAIIVAAGAKWPTGSGDDHVIPLGVPMAPYSGGNGRYRPIRRAQIVTALASGATQIYVDSAVGFATNDVIALFTGPGSTTNILLATLTGVDYDGNRLLVAPLPANATNGVTGAYVEVNENGYLLRPDDAVFLAENVQTATDDDSATFEVPAVGYIAGQVRISDLGTNCYDALIEAQIPRFDYIPATPGA